MSPTTLKTFKLSCICVAVLSVSACASTPRLEEVPGAIGSGLSKAGHKTVELTASAWEGTKKLLHIGPTDQEDEILDEVDLALMDDGLGENDVNIQAVEPIAQLEGAPIEGADVLLPETGNTSGTNELVLGNTDPLTETVPGAEGTPLQASEEMVVASAATDETAAVPLIKDFEHEVKSNETLWEIAKVTTGDANNWHVIADINNLAPDASVHPGQTLMIPADLLKPELLDVPVETSVVAQNNQGETEVKRLNIPTAGSSEELAVADARTNAQSIEANSTMFKVGAGETLWDFAKRTTGDATNWKSIAEQNQFSEKQATMVRPGQKIFVPSDIVKAVGDVQLAQNTTDSNALEASATVLAGNNLNTDDQNIKIVEAAFQSDEALQPISTEQLSAEAEKTLDAGSDELGRVMVSGTYYPKAIYNEADFSSSLLMRVSPGTELTVSKAVGPWLEVQTDKGVGYVHSRDIK